MKQVFQPGKTSARLIVDFAGEQIRLLPEEDRNGEAWKRYLMLYDLYIKARSYSIINKIFFWIALLFGIAVLVWPSAGILSGGLAWWGEGLESAVIQTSITGVAALSFAVYSHYKKRQMHIENLMRYIVCSADDLADIRDLVIREIQAIDMGFGFSGEVLKDKP